MNHAPMPFPGRIIVESNNFCNLRCPSCVTGTGRRSVQGRMSADLFDRIVAEVAEQPGCQFISLQGGGEPLLHPEIADFIRRLAERAPWVTRHISTNATLLTDAMAEALIASGLNQIYFSVDGVTPAVYEKLRPGAKYDRVVANIERFLARNDVAGHPVRTGVTFVRQRDNESEIEAFRQHWENRVDFVNFITYQTYTGRIEDKRVRSDRNRVPEQRHPCRQLLRGDLIIHWDGQVYMCCRSNDPQLLLGNVREESISALFNGKKRQEAVAMHRDHRWDDIAPCRACAQEWMF